MSSSDCMPVGLTYDAGLTDCASSYSLLKSLAIFNLWSAFLSLVFGHNKIRSKLPSCSCSKEWGPWSSIILSLVHPVAMLVATITIRVNGFYPDFALVFAVWTMRPRMVAAPLWYLFSACVSSNRKGPNPYLWTFKDNIIEESLLNVFSLPFAVWYILGRNDAENGSCVEDTDYLCFWNSFYIIAAAGIISILLLAFLVLHFCGKVLRRPKYNRVDNGGRESLSGFWKWTLVVGGLNMVMAFAGQWLLWGSFISEAGTDFCPGSLVGESIGWAAALLFIALGRPLIGGPVS